MPNGSWQAGLGAAVAAAGPAAFAWRCTAAALLGLDGFTPGEAGFAREPEVAVTYPQVGKRSCATGVTRLRNVTPGEVVTARGVPVTAAGRTLTDLGTVAGALLVERAVESALRLGLVTDHELRRRAGLPRRGVGVLRSVMALRPDGAPPTGSDLETRMLQLCRGRLPEPVRQLPVALMGASYRIDMSWPVWGVAVELDGREWHGPEVFDADRRRQNRMVVAGWVVLRFTWADVVTSPDATVRTLATVLRQRGCPGLEAACA